MIDVLFLSDGGPTVGFGHVSRALQVAGLLKKAAPDINLAFQGRLADSVQARIAAAIPQAAILSPAAQDRAHVGVYDTMDDDEDPAFYDADRLASLVRRCGRVVFMANGLEPPALPDNVIGIGYKGGDRNNLPAGQHWGWAYVPVAVNAATAVAPEPGRILVALGGGQSDVPMQTVLAALAELAEVRAVDILLSPVNPARPDASLLRPDQTVTTHIAVPDIVPLLSRADVVLASYGHLGYEALALGRPVCLVGQKRFQAVYAEWLQQAGLAVAAGLVETLQPQALAAALRETFAAADRMTAAARQRIDVQGLQRTATLILNTHADAIGMQPPIGERAL